MEQREHEVLDSFAVLKKLSPPECGAKLQKQTSEATPCFSHFDVAAEERISEKNPAFSTDTDHNGLDHDV
jgi:hypothetical protein